MRNRFILSERTAYFSVLLLTAEWNSLKSDIECLIKGSVQEDLKESNLEGFFTLVLFRDS